MPADISIPREHPTDISVSHGTVLEDALGGWYAVMEKATGHPGALVEATTGGVDQPLNVFSTADLRVSVAENSETFELNAEVPGCTSEMIDIAVVDRLLVIKAEQPKEQADVAGQLQVAVRLRASASTVLLPDGVDLTAISAVLENGILKVSVPKAALAQTPEEIGAFARAVLDRDVALRKRVLAVRDRAAAGEVFGLAPLSALNE